MEVLISQSAYRDATRELDRVAPAEGLCVPLVAIESSAAPWEQMELGSIERLVIARSMPLPSQLQRNGAMRVEAMPRADEWMHTRVRAELSAHPRLRSVAYLHSHPFAWEHTRPSGGDYFGHMKPMLAHNRKAGLLTCFSIIAARSNDRDATEAAAQLASADAGWRFCVFALDAAARIVDLGAAVVVPDDAPAVVRALARPDAVRKSALRHLRRALLRTGCSVHAQELFDGWTRLQVEERGQRWVMFAPLEYPREKVKAYAL